VQTGLGEVCDDGNDVNGDGCNTQCQPEICGNNVLDAGEECDDGNTDDNDGCSALCLDEYCGDGVVQTALQEACDDGNEINDDECSNECLLPSCGDGIWQVGAGEQCDGDQLPLDAPDGAVCNPQCILEYCGDGILNGEEDCDGEAWCTETCEIKELLGLVLDPYCATKAGVGAVLRWSFMNPNGFTVPVSWTLDGTPGGPVMVGAGVDYFAGDTLDAPPSHTLTAWINLPGGPSETFTSNKECEVPPPPPPGGVGAPIPVTSAGGPTDQLIIPVTGLNLMLNLTGLQKLFTYMGLMMFGVTMMLEGVERKFYK
jgi:cysteine-rich repeat protein